MSSSVASWPAYRFLRGQVSWSSIPSLEEFSTDCLIHTVTGFSVVSEAEVDIFLELSCFFCDPTDVGNFISGSSAFSKSSLYIWKFSVHVLLKPSLKDFEHYLASMWREINCGSLLLWIKPKLHVQVLVWTQFSFFLGMSLGVELLGLMITLCFALWGTDKMFYKVSTC